MRKLLFIASLIFTSVLSIAQQGPSKDETIKYIQKRITETSGYQVTWTSGTTEFIHDVNFYDTWATYENGKYNIRYSYKDNYWYYNYYAFKPEFITSVTEASGNTSSTSSVGFIAINFSNSLVVKKVLYNYHGGGDYVNEWGFIKKSNEDSNVNTVYLPYLKQDPTAFERLKKAIMHLKEFYATKDPFAN